MLPVAGLAAALWLAGCGASGAELAGNATAQATDSPASGEATDTSGTRLSPDGPNAAATTSSATGTSAGEADALPTGPVSNLEIPAPGQTSPPPGGSSEAPQTDTSPQCPSMLKAVAVQDCNALDVAYRATHVAYCDYMKKPTPGSEGGIVPFDHLAALESLARVGSQCCHMNTGGAKNCGA